MLGLRNFFDRSWYPLLLIAVLNLALRSINLGEPGLWYDESFTVYHAQQGIEHVWEVGQWDNNPPLYNILISMHMSLFGDSEFSVRFLSVLFASLAAVVLYYSIRKHFNWEAATVVSLLFIGSDFLLRYSQETRSYMLVVLITVIVLHLHMNVLNNPNWKNVLLIGIVFAVGMYTHFAISLLLTCLVGYITIYYCREWRILLRYFAGLLVSVALYAFWLPYLLASYASKAEGTFWLKYHGFSDILIPLKQIFFGEFWYIGLASLVLLGGGLWLFSKPDQSYKNKIILLLVCSLLPPILAGFISFSAPIYLSRYLIFSVLSYIIFIGVIIVYVSPKILGWGALVIIVITQWVAWTPGKSKGQLVREATDYIKEIRKENDLILVQTSSLINVFAYYYDRQWFRNYARFSTYHLENDICPITTGRNLNPEHFRRFNRILLFQAYEQIEDPKQTLMKALNDHFECIEDTAFEKINFYVFENNNPDTGKVYDIVISDSTVTYGGKQIDPKRIGLSIEHLQKEREYIIKKGALGTTQIYDVQFENIRTFVDTYFQLDLDIKAEDNGDKAYFIVHGKDATGKNLGWSSDATRPPNDRISEWHRCTTSRQIKYPNLSKLDEVRFYAEPESEQGVLQRGFQVTIHNVQLIN